jgi:RNA polymerase-binding transcription factor DksA
VAKKFLPKVSGKMKAERGRKTIKAQAPKKAAAVNAPPLPIARTPFSKSELEEYRKLLVDKRHSILGDMGGIEGEALRTNRQESTGDLSNMPTHPADIGTDNYEQEFTLELLESERVLLMEVNEALDRIAKGTYGVCLGTGQFIGKARLKARPWAKYHIDYARLLEKGLANPPGVNSLEEATEVPEGDEEAAEGDEEAPEEAAEAEEAVEEEVEE